MRFLIIGAGKEGSARRCGRATLLSRRPRRLYVDELEKRAIVIEERAL